jgi:lysine 6-dehydrogenase
MKYTYNILGAGMQGTSAAYDLASFGDAATIRLGDASLTQAQASADRVNRLVGREICSAYEVDALDPASLASFLEIDGVKAAVLLSCVPYWMHTKVLPIAIAKGVNMVDMGGDTRVARQNLTLDSEAAKAGITHVPDTGLAPGLVNNLGTYLIEALDSTETVKLYCGGLPQNPKPPFNYKLVFNIEGLVTEYNDQADVLRNGLLTQVETLEELETLELPGLGKMEAFTTSGGTSTAPETWIGEVMNYEYKTIRYPGHCALMKIFKDFGFWGTEPVCIRGGSAIPRQVFNSLMSEKLKNTTDNDLVVVHAIGMGQKQGRPCRIEMDILQRFDEVTGFSAMEQLTGSSTAIYAAAIANGQMQKGCLRYETAMRGGEFVEQLRRRGVQVSIKES